MSNDSGNISSDRPTKKLKKDKLGYKRFAKKIATILDNATTREDCLVLGIHGEWGSGKTSAINLIINALKKRQKNLPKKVIFLKMLSPFSSFIPDWMPKHIKQRTTIIHFSPWLFSNQENLTTAFFHELEKQLDNTWGNIKVFFKTIAALTLPSLEALSYLNPATSKIVGNTTQLLIKNLQKRPSLEQTKQALNKALKAKKRPLLIIIDDIDRLPADEIRQIFRMVKSVADLPYVTYLLGFDQDIVKRALKIDIDPQDNEQDPHRSQWIEKIVQGSFNLPIVLPHKLKNFFWEKLSKELPDLHEQLKLHEGSSYFLDPFFEEFIFKPIQTPRQINRLINALIVQWMAVKDSVNPFDLIFIETCRLFNQGLYQEIKNNKNLFLNPHPEFMSNFKKNCSNFDLFEKLFFNSYTQGQFELYFKPINRINSNNFFYNYFLYDVYDHHPQKHLVPKYNIIDTYLNQNKLKKIKETLETFSSQPIKLSNVIQAWSKNIDTYSNQALKNILHILTTLPNNLYETSKEEIKDLFFNSYNRLSKKLDLTDFIIQLYEQYPFSNLLIFFALECLITPLTEPKNKHIYTNYLYRNLNISNNLKQIYKEKILILENEKGLQALSSDLILLLIIITEEPSLINQTHHSLWLRDKILSNQEDIILQILKNLTQKRKLDYLLKQKTDFYINPNIKTLINLAPLAFVAEEIVKNNDNKNSKQIAQNFLDAYNNKNKINPFINKEAYIKT